MIRFIRWLLGYVEFEFSKGFIDGFVNACYVQGINIYDVKRKGNTLSAKCSAKDYLLLHTIAHSNGGVVKIENKKGLLFPMLKLKGRWGLFAGALAFVLIINFLSGFVWNIEIVGNDIISDEQIMMFLEENDFYKGVYWNPAQADKLEGLIMASFEDCGWVHINRFGSNVRVEISESVAKPDVDDNTGVANLKAVKDGVIVQTNVKNGWQAAFVGDGVSKGDILVSGVYENKDKGVNLFAHASGEFIAQVNEPFSLSVSRCQKSKSYIYDKQYKAVSFFGMYLPLYFGRIDKLDCDVSTDVSYVMLNKNELPIGIIETHAKKYEVIENQLDDKALMELTNKKIDKKLEKEYANCQLISKDLSVSLNSDNAVVKGNVVLLENIGEEIMVYDKKPGLTKQ